MSVKSRVGTTPNSVVSRRWWLPLRSLSLRRRWQALSLKKEDAPERILFFKPMSWLGQIRPHRRDEFFEVYYESIKREPKIRGINKCRCDERLQTKTKEFTRLPYTGLVLELEHLKIETRLISERFANE